MAKINYDNMDDFVGALKEAVKNPNEAKATQANSKTTTETVQATRKERKKFTTFFRARAMLRIDYDDEAVWFSFMSVAQNNSEQNNKFGTTYDKNSLTKLRMPKEELFGFILNLTDYANAVYTNKQPNKLQIIHSTKDTEKKVLEVSVGKDGRTILLSLTNGQNNFIIPFNAIDLKYLIFSLKMILYELYVGTRVGFRYDWI